MDPSNSLSKLERGEGTSPSLGNSVDTSKDNSKKGCKSQSHAIGLRSLTFRTL